MRYNKLFVKDCSGTRLVGPWYPLKLTDRLPKHDFVPARFSGLFLKVPAIFNVSLTFGTMCLLDNLADADPFVCLTDYIFLPELASSFSIFCMVNTHDFLYLSVFANSTLYFAKLSQISTSTELGWSLVLFLNCPTPPHPTGNSKDYTFQEAETRHAGSNGPN